MSFKVPGQRRLRQHDRIRLIDTTYPVLIVPIGSTGTVLKVGTGDGLGYFADVEWDRGPIYSVRPGVTEQVELIEEGMPGES